MQRAHPRLRKTTKWAGLAVSVILLAVWIASARWRFVYQSRAGYFVEVGWGRGAAGRINWQRPESRASLQAISKPQLCWWTAWDFSAPGVWDVYVPIWMMWLPVTIATAAAWRLDALARRRARAAGECCDKCGYSLSGLAPGSACPECGHARSASSQRDE